MRLSNFSGTKTIVMGAFLIFWGLGSFALGIPSATPANMSYPYGHLGYGIWCGVFVSIVSALILFIWCQFTIVGIIDIVLGCRTTPSLVLWALVLNIFASILGVLEMALGTAAANQDFSAMKLREGLVDSYDPNYAKFQELADFYRDFFPMTYKIALSKNLVPSLHNGTVAVDSLLAICGIFAAIFAANVACSCAKVTCCPNIKTDLDSVTVVASTHHEARQKPKIQMMHENAGFQGPPHTVQQA
ncbi:hypothetical protein HELRODRAFT_189731 [Helobdella robusta]|uniref:Uncharacterized protein n=1 Tax=Helobdella robusta TaxID=6412 RepID=T1FRB1_HELRO|nr:hypothetical protein HELRODRAFT_189731 [Helobdella robusta]ESN91573.1 hypothetical protein HELRODRAFT_189731 [Helobdella robusta]